MKTYHAFVLGALFPSALPGVDFIRQSQIANGKSVVSDIQVQNSAGEVTSGNLFADIAIFQLWATHNKNDGTSEILKLDEKSVGTFLPAVDITILSEDPQTPVATRADRPYQVRIQVQGLLNGQGVPDYAKSVLLRSGYQVSSPSTYQPIGSVTDYADPQLLTGNGLYKNDAVIQRLPVAQPTQAVGKETYSAHILPEAGASIAQLDAKEILIWPVATATVNNIESGKTYKLQPPQNASVTLVKAYPRSTTYAQIYQGPPSLGTNGEVIAGSVRTYSTNQNTPPVPQDTTIPLGEINSLMPVDGIYTVEVLTVTPFNNGIPERLAYVSFTIDRSLTVQSMISTAEE